MTFATNLSTFTPFLMNIVGISQAQQATITFLTDHPFTVGEYVSFRVSKPYGMTQLNNQKGIVLSLTPTTITVNIDTSNMTPFVYPPVGEVIYPAVCVPAGSGIIPMSNPSTVNLEDTFDNVPLN